MAPTPVIGGPCQEQLRLQAAGSGTGLSVVDGWGKGCLSRGHAQGTKALAGEWAGTTGARGSPRPLWVATAPLAAVLAPGALPPAEFARLLQPQQESKGKVFSWPAGPEGAGSLTGRVPAVQGNTLRRASETILTSTPQPLSYSPSTLPRCPLLSRLCVHLLAKRTRREEETAWGVHKPGVCTRSLDPYLRARRPAPTQERLQNSPSRPDFPFSKMGFASPRPLFPGQVFLNLLFRAPKTQTALLGRPPYFADKETLPRSAGCATPQPSQAQTAGTHFRTMDPSPSHHWLEGLSPLQHPPLGRLWGLQ